jgi:hypothetical protein
MPTFFDEPKSSTSTGMSSNCIRFILKDELCRMTGNSITAEEVLAHEQSQSSAQANEGLASSDNEDVSAAEGDEKPLTFARMCSVRSVLLDSILRWPSIEIKDLIESGKTDQIPNNKKISGELNVRLLN